MSAAVTMPTVGEIADRLNEPLHRVQYVIKTRGVRPVGVAGNARVFDEAAVDRIADALRDMDARKDGAR